jgi:hypothetical protein
MEVEALSYSEAHRDRILGARENVDKRASTIQASGVMPQFWKWPKFWIGLVLLLWLAYLLNGNLTQRVNLWIVPFFVHPVVTVSAIIFGSMVLGSVLTLLIQFTWWRRASKYAEASAAAAASSNKTVA